MKIDEIKYRKFKAKIESQLRKYPYYMISIETPGLGTACIPGEKVSNMQCSDPVGKAVISDEYKRNIVNAVNYVYEHQLDPISKKIIESSYFLDNLIGKDEIIHKNNISERQYYYMKKNALYKFGIALGYYY